MIYKLRVIVCVQHVKIKTVEEHSYPTVYEKKNTTLRKRVHTIYIKKLEKLKKKKISSIFFLKTLIVCTR